MDHMYANKFTVTVGGPEVNIRFAWITPEYNNNDEVIGNQIVEEKQIVLSREAFDALYQIMGQVAGESKSV